MLIVIAVAPSMTSTLPCIARPFLAALVSCFVDDAVHRELELRCVPLGRSPALVGELDSRIDDQSGATDPFCESLDCSLCPEIVEDRGAELCDQRAQTRHIALELVDRGTHGRLQYVKDARAISGA